MVNEIEKILKPILTKENILIDNIEYVMENNEYYLRIYLDQEKGIDLNVIVDITPVISDLLDEYDIIKNEYILEVSSPGAERKLKTKKDLINAVDKYVRIELINPTKGIDCVEGFLRTFENDVLLIEYLVKNIKKKVEIDYDNVKLARLAVKF